MQHPNNKEPITVDSNLIATAQAYSSLEASEGWTRLIDFMCKTCEALLQELRKAKTDDEIKRLHSKWLHYEECLMLIQNEVHETIENATEYRKQVLKDYIEPTELDQLLRRANPNAGN